MEWRREEERLIGEQLVAADQRDVIADRREATADDREAELDERESDLDAREADIEEWTQRTKGRVAATVEQQRAVIARSKRRIGRA